MAACKSLASWIRQIINVPHHMMALAVKLGLGWVRKTIYVEVELAPFATGR
jgi:hypothetical protein